MAVDAHHTNDRDEKRYFDPIEIAPREEILSIQQDRLLEQVAYVAERSPLIRKLWGEAGIAPGEITSTSAFKALVPFMDKDSLRLYRDETDDPFGGVLCVPEDEVDLLGTSSGTTGDPTIFAESWTKPGDWLWTPREMWELGLRPGDYLAEFNHVMRSVGRLFFHDAGAVPILLNHDAADIPRFIEITKRYRPTWLFHLSSPLIYGLARVEAETGVDLREIFSCYKAVIYTGEPMGAQARAHVERWAVPLYDMTSLGDSGTAWECRARDGFHAWEDLVLFEVVDPETGAPIPAGGRGEMVVTNLVDRTDPLVRYRSGDLVEWTDTPCACGRTHVRFWPLGRIGDEIRVGGVSILPRDVWAAVEAVPATAAGLFQIIRPQREVEQLKLRVGYEGSPDLEQLAGEVSASVERATGIRPVIEFMPNVEILKFGPPHKIPRTAKS